MGHLRFRLRGHLGPSVALKAILDSDCDSVARPSWATYVTYNTKGMNTKHAHNKKVTDTSASARLSHAFLPLLARATNQQLSGKHPGPRGRQPIPAKPQTGPGQPNPDPQLSPPHPHPKSRVWQPQGPSRWGPAYKSPWASRPLWPLGHLLGLGLGSSGHKGHRLRLGVVRDVGHVGQVLKHNRMCGDTFQSLNNQTIYFTRRHLR